MKRLVLSASVLLVLFAAPAALAQGTGGFQFGLSGGASFPTSDWSDAYGTGYNGGIVLYYELPALPLGFRVDGDYRNFSAKTSGAFSRSAEIFDGNANLVIGIRILLVKVYALGGGGFYNMKFTSESAGVSTSISQTDFCTSRCTIVSRPTPPFCEFDTPSTDCEVAPISIFSSV